MTKPAIALLSTPPERMPPAERLDEMARILAAGVMRLLAQQSSPFSSHSQDSLLDFSPLRSGVRRYKLRNRVGGA